MSPHSRTRTALALGAVAIALLGADSARADYTAAVEDGTLTLTGDAADDTLVLIGTAPTLFVDVGGDGTPDFEFDRNTFTAISVLARGGDDEVRTIGSLADEQLTIDGGGDDDALLGSNGADILRGGSGRDFVDGQQGADVAELGSGSDTFQWDPGDGNDVVDGESGNDALAFNGSNIGELIDISANGGRTQLTRNIANIVMDLGGLERLGVRALGGTDTVTVGDLSGTGVEDVDVDLALTGGATDPVPDTVVVNGTEKRDVVRLARSGDQVLATGLAATTRISGSELLSDTLRVLTHGGDDAVQVSPAVETLITPVIDLGPDE